MAQRRTEENLFQGDFGETWLEAVAAGSEILHGRPTSLDLEKADVELVVRGLVSGTYNPTVKAQVKTSINARTTEQGDIHYDLDVVTHDVLRRTDHLVPRVLVVIALSAEGETIGTTDEGTLLRGRARWVSLRGEPAVTTTSTTAVVLPAENTVDEEGLRTMLSTHGIRTSTPVPEIDEEEE